jgi:serine protease Do
MRPLVITAAILLPLIAASAWHAGQAAPVRQLLLASAAPPAGTPGASAAPADPQPLVAAPEPAAIVTYAPMLAAVSPCVVTVYSSRLVEPPAGADLKDLGEDPAFQQFFSPFFGDVHAQPRRERGLGSGVIVRSDGYILTNNHVVEGADEVRIGLGDGSADIPATVVGGDPMTDLAVLKIAPAARHLQPIRLGASSRSQVGDLVFAVGNPFGVGETVTMGIISAVGRGGMHIEDYEDFLQTDAAVNPGNSGGALVSSDGRLVGINTAIVSPSGGNNGVGFAIPSDLAASVMSSIIATGTVARGFLGVLTQTITPELEAALHLNSTQGALVGDVVPGSPAAAAGLQSGDVITRIDATPVTDPRHLRLVIGAMAPATRITIDISHGGQRQSLALTLAATPHPSVPTGAAPASLAPSTQLGLRIGDLAEPLRQRLGAPADVQGVVVEAVDEDSPAADAGLEPGDIIIAVAGQPVGDAGDLAKRLHGASGDILLRIWSKGARHFAVIRTPLPAAKQP